MDLIKRLEAATEGSREKSDEIGEHIGAEKRYLSWASESTYHLDYTTSIDAALTLVPEGCYAGLDPIFFEEGTHVKYDAIICRANWKEWTPLGSDWIDRLEARATTPALALCIAALKARAETD